MIIECPSCGVRGNSKNETTDVLSCRKCGTIFSVSETRLPDHGISERVWRVRGETGRPVSLRVLRYRLKTGTLSPEHEISKDGEVWIKACDHPAITASTIEFPAAPLSAETFSVPPGTHGLRDEHSGESDDGFSPQQAMSLEKTAVLKVRRRSLRNGAVALGFACFAVGASAAFFFPLSENLENLSAENEQLTLKNMQLKSKLASAENKIEEAESKIGEAESKIEEMEKQLALLGGEFDRVKSSSEEFLRARTILEDIKKSIDSHNLYLVVSLAEDRLYVKIGTKTVKQYTVSTGKGETILKGTGKPYNFLTPRGKMVIQGKEENPVWLKPDWAWLEEGAELPTNISLEDRAVEGELGKYRLKMGGGYAIHGTKSGTVNGKKETHGCIRLSRKDLKELYAMVKPGTEVYIY